MASVPKVLHVGNPANVAAELRDELAASGKAECIVFETSNNRLQFAEDVRFSWDWLSSVIQKVERHASHALLLKSLLDEADILHMHASGTVAVAAQRWARARGKPVIRHFHGQEVRAGSTAGESRSADAIFVSTPDLLQHMPRSVPRHRVTWIPNPRRFPEGGRGLRMSRPVRIVHAHLRNPSYASAFGSPLVHTAVENLRTKGLDVVLDEVSGVAHEEALARYQVADVAIDKLRIGWYGTFGVECLALGMPVLAGVSPDLLYLNPPVLPVTDETVEPTLESLVRDPQERQTVGLKLFKKAREVHERSRVAEKVWNAYETLLE